MIAPLERLVLVRHCSTEENENARLLSAADPGLSPLGLQQAVHLAKWFSLLGTVQVVSSPASRATQTCEAISVSEFQVDDRLRERALGPWEGLTAEDLESKRRSRGLDLRDMTQDWRGEPEVEQDAAVASRAWAAVEAAASGQDGASVVVVAHAGVLKSLFYAMMQISADRVFALRVTLGGAMVFRQRKGMWELQELWPNPGAHAPAIL